MAKVSVVILNWNGRKFLQKFLPSVVEHTTLPDTEIVVADNGSTDDSLQYLKQNFPSVKIIAFDQNYGFTGGYNRALAQIDAEYYVLLNSDIETTPNWLQPIIQLMDSDEQIAAATPKLLDYNRKEYFEYAGATGGFIDKYGYPFCRGRIINTIEKDEGQYNNTTEVFWGSGACLVVRAKLYSQLGGLDEDFFAHMEEIDLCWRLKNEGYKIMYVPQSSVYHVGGGTLPSNNPKKIYLNYRNNLFLLLKNLPKQKLFPIIFTRMVLDGMSGGVYLLQGKFSFFTAVIKAHFAFYKKIKKIKRKRKNNINLQQNLLFNKSILIRYFIKKEHTFSQLKF